MSQVQWKKFQFFDVKNLGSESSRSAPANRSTSVAAVSEAAEPDPESIKNLSEITRMKFLCNILGIFWVGTASGRVFCCLGDEVKSTFQAHTHNLYCMAKSRRHPLLITVGLDEGDFNRRALIKFWDISDTTSPREIISIPLPDAMANAALCFVITDDLTRMAVGLNTGQIYLVMGEILAGPKGLNKRVLNTSDPKNPITNLFFLNKGGAMFLFYTTMKSVGSFLIKEKNEVHNQLQEGDGCAYMCADVDEKKERLIVGMAGMDVVTIFYPEFRGQTWSFEGEKTTIRCSKNHVVVVSVVKNQHQLTIYDVDNKLIAFLQNYSQIDHVLSEEDGIYIISRNTKKEIVIQQLMEKDTSEKLAILFKKNSYDIAYSMARSEGYEESFIAEISRMQGDHYYNKGDFDNAINYYKQTVGHLEASYVIIKFLDASKINYLTNYLEHLHNKHQANNEHTALLLNCYVHLKATQELAHFLAQSDDDYELFDPKTAIDVCCGAKCYELALDLASKHKMHSVYIKILIEEQKNFREALRYMENDMSVSGVAKLFKDYGQVLMKNESTATRDMLFRMINSLNLKQNLTNALPESEKDEKQRRETEEPEDYLMEENAKKPLTLTYHQVLEAIMSGLVNDPEVLDELLTAIIKKFPDIDPFVYHKLFELYLQQRKPIQDQELLKKSRQGSTVELYSNSRKFEASDYARKIKDLLESANNRYDKHYVLMLFKMYDFSEGVVYLSQFMDNQQELMFHYIKTNDVLNIWNTCMKYGKEDNDLWLQALTYFCSKDDPRGVPYIQKILKEIEQKEFLTPLIVLEILCKSKKITFETVKNYLKKQLQRQQKSMESDQVEFERNMVNISQKKKEIYELKTQCRKFQFNKCANCDGKLSLPSVHFMCSHSYHQHCLPDNERECQLCSDMAMRALERKNEFKNQSMNHETFYKELGADRFDAIAKYFGRGLFSGT